MEAEICEEPATGLEEYARVSIAFEVDRVLLEQSTAAGSFEGLPFCEQPLIRPYVKNYDLLEGNHPRDWEARFDLSGWGLFSARTEGVRVGGALVAHRDESVRLLEGRGDLALLWDLRVSPTQRGSGVGSALLRAVEHWAVARGCRQLGVETQNTNVVACRFYARRGFELRAINRFAYPEVPDEIQLLWHKDLRHSEAAPLG